MLIVCKFEDLSKKQTKTVSRYINGIKSKRCTFKPDSKGHFHFCYCIINLTNGKFYIGKHSSNKDPNKVGTSSYQGTSKWLDNSIAKYGSEEFRFIVIQYFKTDESAFRFEESLITIDMINSKLCYNVMYGGKGLTSKSAVEINKRKLRLGIHHLQRRKDGTSLSGDRAKLGLCPFQTRPDGTNVQTDRIAGGTHHFLKQPDGSSTSKNLVNSGKHHLLRRKDGTSPASDKVIKGTHHFLKQPDGSSIGKKNALRRVSQGTHNFLNILPWEHHKVGISSLETWALSDKIYKLLFKKNIKIMIKNIKLYILDSRYKQLNWNTLYTIIAKLEEGWIPNEDSAWRKKFK